MRGEGNMCHSHALKSEIKIPRKEHPYKHKHTHTTQTKVLRGGKVFIAFGSSLQFPWAHLCVCARACVRV